MQRKQNPRKAMNGKGGDSGTVSAPARRAANQILGLRKLAKQREFEIVHEHCGRESSKGYRLTPATIVRFVREGSQKETVSGHVNEASTKSTAEYIHRLEAEFLCDELTAIVYRLRELIRNSRSHNRTVFLLLTDDTVCDLLEAVDRGWPSIEEIAGDLRS